MSLVTGSEIGNGSQTVAKTPHRRAKMLMAIPQRPRLKGPYAGGLFSSFRSKMKEMGMMYEMYSENVARDRMAKNAVVDPMLNRARTQLRIETRYSAFVGIFSVG